MRSHLLKVVLALALAGCGDDGGGEGMTDGGDETRCTDDPDCPSGEVCDTGAGVCVECLEDPDCPSGATCMAGECRTPDGCTGDDDCDGASLCDTSDGMCVECLASTDCAAASHCAARVCTEDVCEEGTATCLDDATLESCAADGSSLDTTSCADTELCALDACVPRTWHRRLVSDRAPLVLGGVYLETDGGMTLAATTAHDSEVDGAFIARVGPTGNRRWGVAFETDQPLAISDVTRLPDAAYMVVGSYGEAATSRAFVARLSAAGELEWQRIAESIIADFSQVSPSPDGAYVAGTYRSTSDPPVESGLVARLRNDGTLVWARRLQSGTRGLSVLGDDSGVVATAHDTDTLAHAHVIALNAAGERQWYIDVEDALGLNAAHILPLSGGGYVITSDTGDSGAGYAFALDAAGALQWARSVDAGGTEGFRHAVEVDAGAVSFVGGSSGSDAPGGLVVELDSSGALSSARVVEDGSGGDLHGHVVGDGSWLAVGASGDGWGVYRWEGVDASGCPAVTEPTVDVQERTPTVTTRLDIFNTFTFSDVTAESRRDGTMSMVCP